MTSFAYHNPDVHYRYYLIIPNADAQAFTVLLERRADGTWSVPNFAPQEHHFGAIKHINDWIWEQHGLYLVTLRCFNSLTIAPKLESRFYIMNNLHPEWRLPETMRWFTENEIKAEVMLDMKQKQVLLDWYNWRHSDTSLRVGWMRQDWFHEAGFWMLDLADRMAMGASEYVEQVRVWSRAAVLRLQTDDGTLYMKAVPEVLSYEPVLTRVLGIRFPGFIPDVRAVHVENAWMLMRDFGGTPLSEIKSLDVWKRVLKNYADIQIDLISNTQSLIALGVPDRSVDYLSSQIDRLMVHLPESLAEDEVKELRRSAATLKNMCFELLEHNIPLSLTHGDFVGNNIVVKADNSCLFFDWSDASISHPFFDLPPFLADAAKVLGSNDVKLQLLDTYFNAWTRFEPKANLRRAYAVTEILAGLHQALFYYTHILPSMETSTKWEMQHFLPSLLRDVLAQLQVFKR